ncbi:hypothetical protein TNCV_849091 [Trichonephila clavipes]|uniref:Uncharacterized protein n=1 Tax=Trichonephila clavipes TaxID=2585209 RepID=A0A8X6RMM9_TRICX|nr:hypothetical protein TNCV_849091 [Trichonephila clavipes]
MYIHKLDSVAIEVSSRPNLTGIVRGFTCFAQTSDRLSRLTQTLQLVGRGSRLEIHTKPFATAVDLNGQKIKYHDNQRAGLFPALDRTFCCQDLNRSKVWTNKPTNLPHSPLGFELTPLLTADPLLALETFCRLQESAADGRPSE